jgi:hypothetical protein
MGKSSRCSLLIDLIGHLVMTPMYSLGLDFSTSLSTHTFSVLASDSRNPRLDSAAILRLLGEAAVSAQNFKPFKFIYAIGFRKVLSDQKVGAKLEGFS